MIGNRACLEQISFVIFDDAANVGVECIANIIGKPRLPVLRGKDHMHEDLRERLRHTYFALSGLGEWLTNIPRALPWAISYRPVGACAIFYTTQGVTLGSLMSPRWGLRYFLCHPGRSRS